MTTYIHRVQLNHSGSRPLIIAIRFVTASMTAHISPSSDRDDALAGMPLAGMPLAGMPARPSADSTQGVLRYRSVLRSISRSTYARQTATDGAHWTVATRLRLIGHDLSFEKECHHAKSLPA